MELHQAGKVTNDAKGLFSGVSVTTFALGSSELYRWLDGNDQVAFVPVEVVNDPSVIAANHTFVSINGALSVDLYGQVVADSIDGKQVSGVGGHEDFVAGAELRIDDHSLICLRSTAVVDGDHPVTHRSLPARGIGGLHPPPPHRGRHHRVRRRRPVGPDRAAKGPPPWPRSPIPISGTNCTAWPTPSDATDAWPRLALGRPTSTRSVGFTSGRHSGHEVARDAMEPGSPLDGIGGLQAREHGRLDTAGIDSGIGPVPGQEQVVVAALVRRSRNRSVPGRDCT